MERSHAPHAREGHDRDSPRVGGTLKRHSPQHSSSGAGHFDSAGSNGTARHAKQASSHNGGGGHDHHDSDSAHGDDGRHDVEGGAPLLPQLGKDPPSHTPSHREAAGHCGEAQAGGGRGGARRQVLRALAVLGVCAAWTLVSPATVIINTHMLKDAGFPYPTTIALIGLLSTTILSATAVRFVIPRHRRTHVSRRFFVTRVLPTGVTMALTFQMGNSAYLFLSFSFLQMLKALTPVITMAMVFVVGLEKPTSRLVASVTLISLGVGMASYGEIHLNTLGLTLMLCSIVCECARCVMTQHLLAGAGLHPLEAAAYIGLASSLSLTVQVTLFELRHLVANRAWELLAAHPWQTAAVALAGFSVNSLAILVINMASSLTLKVLGTVKDIGLVLFGVVYRHEIVSPLQVYGYAISLIGFCAYNLIKYSDGQAGAARSKTG